MIATWILFAIGAGFASNLYNFLNRYVLRKVSDSTGFGWLSEVVRLTIALIILPFDFRIDSSGNALWFFLILGVIEVASIYVFMKMHAFTHLSISTIISRTRLIWVPLIAYIFFGEQLKFIEYIGIGILFLGLSVAVSPHKLFMDKGVVYSYISAFIVAVLTIFMKLASPVMSTSLVLIGMSYLAVLLLPIMMQDAQKRIKTIVKKDLLLKITASVCNVIAMYLYVYALRIGQVSKVTAIYQGMMIFSIVAGIVFLGEKKDALKKIIGSLITLVGVLLLTAL